VSAVEDRLTMPAREARGRRAIALATRSMLLSGCSVLLVLILWGVSTSAGWISPLFLPSLTEVAHTALQLASTGELWKAVWASTIRVLAGFALATLVAVPLGISMATFWPVRAVMAPFVSLLRPLPSITWIPLTILWLGIGEQQKIVIVFLGCWVYILLSTFEATRHVDPLLVRAARNLGAGDLAVMREVIFPGALPGILAGLKVSLAIAWSCVLSAEMVAARKGLGALIWEAKDWGNMAIVLVGMLSISLTVLVADAFAHRLERWLQPWQRNRSNR
jgi:taurine transport system permease protein